MSSILKALKKVEDDKSTLRPDDLKIDAEILRYEPSSNTSSAAVIILSLLLLAAGSAATYIYMKRDVPSKSLISTQLSNAPSVEQNLPKVITPDLVIKPESISGGKTVVPAIKEKIVRKTVINSKESVTEIKTPTDITPQKAAASVSTVSKITTTTSTVKPKSIPTLRVNGIGFQNNSADSLAIVNGNPVAMGGLVDGAVVEKILNDKVIFQINGEKIEVNLGQSNR